MSDAKIVFEMVTFVLTQGLNDSACGIDDVPRTKNIL